MPRDPQGTLQRVRGGTLRVGVTEQRPWVRLDEGQADRQPSGVEVELIEEFARQLDARIEWFHGSESEVLQAIEHFELDVAVGGFTESNPWSKRVGLTRSYVTTALVVAVPLGAPVPESIEGLKVAVEPGSPAAARVRQRGGIPVPTSDLAQASGPVAAQSWRIEALGLKPTAIHLHEDKHVMAVPPGENGFLLALDRFLAQREADVRQRLVEEARP